MYIFSLETGLNNLTKRILTALWGIPLILFLTYKGSIYFLILVLIINGISLYEFYFLHEKLNIFPFKAIGVFFSSLILLTVYFLSLDFLYIGFLITVVALLLWHLRLSKTHASVNTSITLSGTMYITLFLSALILLRQNFDVWVGVEKDQNVGGIYFLFFWISIWVSESFAYFGGYLFGKHKLAPHTSPNKTIEGAFFALIGPFIIFLGITPFFLPQLALRHLIISALIVGILGQIGDLVESRFKRDAVVKDTSNILLGHGGFLDRFDSLIFVSPFLYLYFYFTRF